jgi:hypothetical protein
MSITRELTSLSALNGMGLQTSFSLKGKKKGGGGGGGFFLGMKRYKHKTR